VKREAVEKKKKIEKEDRKKKIERERERESAVESNVYWTLLNIMPRGVSSLERVFR